MLFIRRKAFGVILTLQTIHVLPKVKLIKIPPAGGIWQLEEVFYETDNIRQIVSQRWSSGHIPPHVQFPHGEVDKSSSLFPLNWEDGNNGPNI